MAPVPDFDKREYWSQRFASESAFEWLIPSQDFVKILDTNLLTGLPPDAPILHLGFGTSDLQIHLRQRGFLNVTNVDYEPMAIKRGRELEQATFGDIQMAYLVADATQLDLDQKFALVLDKSAADAIACGGEAALFSMADSVRKHLQEGACWVSVSYSAYRFDDAALPFHVRVISKIPVKKARETEPDVFLYCYLLRAR